MRARIEEDSLGKRRVPRNAYYGIQTLRAAENFPISGCRAHPLLIRAIGMVKKAASQANASLGLLDRRRGRAIQRAATEVISGQFDDQFIVDVYQAGAGVSFQAERRPVHIDPGRVTGRIHLADAWSEQDIDAGFRGDPFIARFIARIRGQIGRIAEFRA